MNLHRLLPATAGIAATGLLLTGCAGATAETPAADAGAIVVYSNSVSDGRGEWLIEQAAEAGFEVEYVDAGGGAITERIIAESANPIADVVFGPNNVNFESMKAAGALEAYTPAWADKVDAIDPDGTYHSIVEEPIMVVYNTAAFPNGAGAPTDWTDLFEDEQYHGRYETQTSLSGGTTQLVITSLLSRYRDDSGELGISDEGWAAIDAFFANGSPAVEGTDLYARMSAGDVDLGQMWLAGKASREVEYGIETEAIRPAGGVPIVNQGIGLVKGSDNNDQAQEFIDWFGSAEVQAAWSQEFFTAPTNADALANADQDAVEMTGSFTPQDIDWSFVSENLPAWIEEIELNHLG
ncbi:extracellular solute-binding protein [Microbacterium esteraromaticum]|uniref:extracellular solute-binding protein n=1 Tax=Microbacterium esteraromaticum TaxID=57043 RepID=UPI001CD197A4|nr:extracellular solute-binding protein [Microbacterium esteraromaticum]MCA1306919.1 extracellular solute-binding protein [Microbacterium esteraromaticum]